MVRDLAHQARSPTGHAPALERAPAQHPMRAAVASRRASKSVHFLAQGGQGPQHRELRWRALCCLGPQVQHPRIVSHLGDPAHVIEQRRAASGSRDLRGKTRLNALLNHDSHSATSLRVSTTLRISLSSAHAAAGSASLRVKNRWTAFSCHFFHSASLRVCCAAHVVEQRTRRCRIAIAQIPDEGGGRLAPRCPQQYIIVHLGHPPDIVKQLARCRVTRARNSPRGWKPHRPTILLHHCASQPPNACRRAAHAPLQGRFSPSSTMRVEAASPHDAHNSGRSSRSRVAESRELRSRSP